MGACGCIQCLRDRDEHTMIGRMKIPAESSRMVVCNICGNKRCPRASNHRNACTDSNTPGQSGSVYAKPSAEGAG